MASWVGTSVDWFEYGMQRDVPLHTRALSVVEHSCVSADRFAMSFCQFDQLYGKHAAALYAQAADFNKTARFYYMKAQDAYYLANAQASYDDWRRARRQWDYFYRRK